MISQCANPACSVPFHYLRGGRLYRFDINAPDFPCKDVPNSICTVKPSRSSVFFWLCEQCAAEYGLKFSFRDGVKLVPAARLSTAPVIAIPGSCPQPAGRNEEEL